MAGASLREKDVEGGSRQAVWAPCQHDPPTVFIDKQSLPEPAFGPRHQPAAPSAKFRGKVPNGGRLLSSLSLLFVHRENFEVTVTCGWPGMNV